MGRETKLSRKTKDLGRIRKEEAETAAVSGHAKASVMRLWKSHEELEEVLVPETGWQIHELRGESGLADE